MALRRTAFAATATTLGLATLLMACTDGGASKRNEAGGGGTPHLEATPAVIDLGAVPVGEWVTATFHLRNSGDVPLRFVNAPWVKAVAGC